MFGFILLLLFAGLIYVAIKSIYIVPEASEFIVEYFGKYHETWKAGLHFKIPIVMTIAKRISLKEQVADFDPQPVITRDNVTMQVDSVVFFKVVDSIGFTYGVERPISAIENLSATTLRNIIGSMTLDETLTSRDSINTRITEVLDEATDRWGIQVYRVEVKNINPPRSIQEAMEKEMKAEREKRGKILDAEGEKAAAILKADAVKEQTIREAQGKAESIRLINESAPGVSYLQLEQYLTARAMADGQATKIIVPSDMTNLVSGLTAMVETGKPLVSNDNSSLASDANN